MLIGLLTGSRNEAVSAMNVGHERIDDRREDQRGRVIGEKHRDQATKQENIEKEAARAIASQPRRLCCQPIKEACHLRQH